MNDTLRLPRVVVAGTSSGVGKTTLVAGLITALRRRGLVVQPFKCGPDYIDPTYHTHAAGRPCRNLDSWMLDDAGVAAAFQRACRGADLAVIECVMGLFDGSDYVDERASAAQIAKLLDAPVLLVLDISGAARSVAAMAHGYAGFDPAVRVGACALNFAGSAAHADGCSRALAAAEGPRALGWLPRDAAWSVPERHLGLVPSAERGDLDRWLAPLADTIEANFDLDAVIALARSAAPLRPVGATSAAPVVNGPLLAVARDEAFAFYYPDNLELLEAAGARIAFFSPLRGELPPREAAGVYLGGGYPELHAAALSAHTALWENLRARHRHGSPIWAECGGFMVLAEALIDREGRRWPMAGLVPGVARMTGQLVSLGYRHATAARANLFAEPGETLRGHEFHYSVWEGGDAAASAWSLRSTRGAECIGAGHADGSLLASYLHIHLGQHPRFAARLVERLRASAEANAPFFSA